MKLSTRGRYGTRVLLDLALRDGEGLVQLKEIAGKVEITLPYLERIIGPLVAAGMLRSVRGARGGVCLAKPPGEIKLSEVINVLEGSIAPVDCISNPKACARSEYCVTRDVWNELKDAMNGVLESTTLQDLVERHKEKGRAPGGIYQI